MVTDRVDSIFDKPFFSVIVPTKDRESELIRSITSVVDQSFSNWELIVIEDGSENQSRIVEKIKELNDSRITIITLPNTLNAANARNYGIAKALGNWIAFLDSDDHFVPEKLDIFFKIISETKNTADIYYSQFNQIADKKTSVIPKRGKMECESIGDYIFVDNNAIGTPGLVVKADWARQTLFDPWCKKHQDYDFLLRSEHMGARIEFVEKVLWNREFRKSKNNIGTMEDPIFSGMWLKKYKKYLSSNATEVFHKNFILAILVKHPIKLRLLEIIRIVFFVRLPFRLSMLTLAAILPYRIFYKVNGKKSKRID